MEETLPVVCRICQLDRDACCANAQHEFVPLTSAAHIERLQELANDIAAHKE
jgi:hypothetical protein